MHGQQCGDCWGVDIRVLNGNGKNIQQRLTTKKKHDNLPKVIILGSIITGDFYLAFYDFLKFPNILQ